MKPHVPFGLVLVVLLLGFVHLAMYLPGGIGTTGVVALAGLALTLVVYLGVSGARRLRYRSRTHSQKVPHHSNPV